MHFLLRFRNFKLFFPYRILQPQKMFCFMLSMLFSILILDIFFIAVVGGLSSLSYLFLNLENFI